jgi:hypothetical protein
MVTVGQWQLPSGAYGVVVPLKRVHTATHYHPDAHLITGSGGQIYGKQRKQGLNAVDYVTPSPRLAESRLIYGAFPNHKYGRTSLR